MTQPRQMIPDGGVEPGFNNTGSDIAVALFVSRSTVATDADGIQLPTDHTTPCVGLTLELTKNGYRGDMQTKGLGIATSAAAIARGDQVEALAAGTAQTLTGGGKSVGIANTATTGSGQQFEIDLRLPSS